MDQGTMEVILAAVAGGVVVPIVEQLKKTVVTTYIKPEFLTVTLLTLVAWGVTAWLAPPVVVTEVFKLGFAAAGAAGVVYATTKKKNNGQ